MAILAVDIGNSRIKLGLFDRSAERLHKGNGVPQPEKALALPAADWNANVLQNWLADVPSETPWWIASVNRPATAQLIHWLAGRFPTRLLSHADLPIGVAVEFPDRVGIDRLSGGVAANRLRNPARAAIVIGVGSAITVDLISADGVFRGGAILPGIGMSARALHEFTDLLPRSPLEELSSPPPALGTSTMAAIHAGLYWGAIGALRELIARLAEQVDEASPGDVFLTGGAAPAVAAHLDPAARYIEYLVLSGIVLAKDPSCPTS